MSKTSLLSRLLDHAGVEPELDAQHRWRQIERAAMDFRAAYQFSPSMVRICFPPMNASEAARARNAAYHWSFHAHITDTRAAYLAEIAAINAAEVQ